MENFKLDELYPRTPQKSTFSEEIKSVSPAFIEIFDQALAAEAANLDQIAGIGFRKALEFLIKDFVIHRNGGEAESVKSKLLGKVIKDYIEDPQLKTTAQRATWLGNDETHYVRKWEDRDIDDLKLLIRLSVNWIENILLTERYMKEMPATP